MYLFTFGKWQSLCYGLQPGIESVGIFCARPLTFPNQNVLFVKRLRNHV